MKIAQFTQRMIMLVTVLTLNNPSYATVSVDESDAMQITTHFNDLTSIACDSTAQYCVSVGVVAQPHQIDHIVYTTSNGGIKWSSGFTLPHPDGEDAIEDPKNSNQNFMQIRCDTSAQNCVIAGAISIGKQSQLVTYTSHNGGQTWTAPNVMSYPDSKHQILTEDYPFLRLKCSANINWCVLISNTIIDNQPIPALFTTQDGGDSWSAATLNIPLNADTNSKTGVRVLDLGCDQSGLFCTALTAIVSLKSQSDEESAPPVSAIYSTHDGGVTWSDAKPLVITQNSNPTSSASTQDLLHIISCDRSSGLRCIALGLHITNDENQIISSHAYLTKNGGLSWQDTTEIPASDATHMNIFTALHCDVNNRFCAAVGISVNDEDDKKDFPIIYTTIDGGQTWQKKPFTSPNDAVSLMLDVFCSDDAAFCHAVGAVL